MAVQINSSDSCDSVQFNFILSMQHFPNTSATHSVSQNKTKQKTATDDK